MVKPLDFFIENRYLKRAGLDYWDKVDIQVWDSFSDVIKAYANSKIYLATTKAERSYHQVQYNHDDMLVFGRETRGLPDDILNAYPEQRIRIPMLDIGRSLNLSNSAAIMIYEALRQQQFPGLR